MTSDLRIEWKSGEFVSARFAAGRDGPGVLLANGAGADQDSPFIVRVRDGLASGGLPVMTFNYPYQEAGRSGPNAPAVLMQCHSAAAAELRKRCDRSVLAGKSMGGRMASHLAAEGEPAAGLIFYGYPLVAIGKTEARSTEHLRGIDAPMLFFNGTRDRLAPLELIEGVTARLRRARLVVVEDGDHSFKVRKRAGRTWEEVVDGMVADSIEWLGGF